MSPQSPSSEISSLIRLLDDPDTFVMDRVGARLVELGGEAVPFLEMATRGENLVLKNRAQKILERIAPLQLAEAFRELSRTPPGEDIDLEKGVTLLMQFGHPGADPQAIYQTLDRWAEELSPRINPNAPSEQVLEQFNDFLFQQKNFQGNQEDFFDPDNSYFDTVLNNRRGIPITLSALYIFLGRRLKLPIVGVGLPYHFISKYNSAENPILFDPFNRGRRLSPEQCREMVTGFGVKFEEHFLSPVTHREILIRMIQNLVGIYQKNNDPGKVQTLKEYSKILLSRS